MSMTGTFSGPPAPIGGSASANSYDTIQELLYKLPDNTANSIQAKDVRDSVYSLWERISDVSASQSQAIVEYTNTTPTPVTIGGIVAGSTFASQSMSEMWDMLLYPYILPQATLSGGTTREYGDSNMFTLTWDVVKNSDTIQSITVDGVVITVTGLSQSGSQGAAATPYITTTFSMSVDDGTNTVLAYTSFYWSNAIYWGTFSSFGNPGLALSGSKPFWANGAGVGTGKLLSTDIIHNYNGIDGGGNYLVFAWPKSYAPATGTILANMTSGTGYKPVFTINGQVSTAWTKIGNNISFTNYYSYVEDYDIWISDTPQYAQINNFDITILTS